MKRSAFLLPALMLFAGCSTSQMAVDTVSLHRPEAAPVMAKGLRNFRAKEKSQVSYAAASNSMEDSANFQAPAGRKMTYSTNLVINVPDTVKGVKKASSIAEKHTGYTTYSDNSTANVKIPVAKAQDALKDFEAIGKVTSKTITANDITEHYTDTQVRLENLRRLQKRLSELLTRANKVDDILRIERELSRVTTDLERHQARMNVLSKQVEMVDFTINFKAVVTPAEISRTIIPVDCVRELGSTIRNEKFVFTGNVDDTPADFELPAGFAVTLGREDRFKATNSDNVVLKLETFDNLPQADLAFYQKLIEKQLKNIGYTDINFEQAKTADDVEYLAVSADSGANTFSAMVAIYKDGWLCKDEKVAVTEMYGPADAMKKVDLNKFYKSFEF